MGLETGTYRLITEDLVKLAHDMCDGRVISALEGGYDRDALAASTHAHIGALLQQTRPRD
jgi:acetoin utilization deacetylase AcuC-like enzyme